MDLRGTHERSPLNLFLILDHSEHVSQGGLLDAIKMTGIIVLEALQPGDRVTVVACGAVARVIVDGAVKGVASMADEERKIMSLNPEAGSDLIGAVVMAGWRAKATYAERWTNRLIVLGCGWCDSEAGLTHIVKDLARDCIYTHVYAYGEAFNVELLLALASVGLGQFHRITTSESMTRIVGHEITQNAVAGKHVRVCVRPRHKNVAIQQIYDHDSTRENDTLLVDVGDVYFGTTVGLLVKLSYQCTPGRKDLLEVHVSHYDAEGDRHLRTMVQGAVFVLDEVEAGSALPLLYVVDKVMKVNTALALVLAEDCIKVFNFFLQPACEV